VNTNIALLALCRLTMAPSEQQLHHSYTTATPQLHHSYTTATPPQKSLAQTGVSLTTSGASKPIQTIKWL
jgi:hypothetical protein